MGKLDFKKQGIRLSVKHNNCHGQAHADTHAHTHAHTHTHTSHHITHTQSQRANLWAGRVHKAVILVGIQAPARCCQLRWKRVPALARRVAGYLSPDLRAVITLLPNELKQRNPAHALRDPRARRRRGHSDERLALVLRQRALRRKLRRAKLVLKVDEHGHGVRFHGILLNVNVKAAGNDVVTGDFCDGGTSAGCVC